MHLRNLVPTGLTGDGRNGAPPDEGDGRDDANAERRSDAAGGEQGFEHADLADDDADEQGLERADLADDAADAADVAADDLLKLLSNRRRRYLWRALRDDGRELNLSDASRRIAAWENDITPADVEYDQRKSVYNSLHQFHCPKMADAGLIEFDKRGSTVRLPLELPSQLTVTVEPDTKNVRNTACGALALAAGIVLGAWALGLPMFGSMSLAAVGLSLGIGTSAALLVYSLFVRTEYGLSLADALSRVDS
ncbi:MAG: DUF7344 domain-containing protein [Halorubrum sp.]